MKKETERLYQEAYNLHYKAKDYYNALNSYLRLIKLYPDSNEAKYSKQQVDNIIKLQNPTIIDDDVKDTYNQLLEEEAKINEREDRERLKLLEYQKTVEERKRKMDEIMLTTCQHLAGYTIKEELGLVFGEVFFKNGFLKSLSATLDNIAEIYFLEGDVELSGPTKQLDDARKYAIDKIKANAFKKGANAIIGIDSESSIGTDIVHVCIMGTAVSVEKCEE